MNQRQPHRRRKRMKKNSFGNEPELSRRFLDTMKQQLNTTMDEARSRFMKARDQGRFFFLKGGEVWPPNQADSPLGTQTASVQEARSRPSESEQCQRSAISAVDRILESAERLNASAQIAQIMSDVTRLAQAGDTEMVEKLHWIAVKAIAVLNSLVIKNPKVLRPIARKELCWPALIGRKRSIKQTNDHIIKIIELGADEVWFSNRGWQMSAPSTQAAFDLFLTAESYQNDWRLPPLTNKTKRTWFEAAWQQMLNDGIEPEKIPWLAPVGKSAIGKRSISRGMPAQTGGMKHDDVRAEIKRQVWNAFEKLVGTTSEKSK
jgi:hypothetical protein